VRFTDRLRASARVATAVALGSALSLGAAAAATAQVAAPSRTTAPSAAAQLISAEQAGSAHASQPALTSADSGSKAACSAVVVVGRESCFALKRDGVTPKAASVSPDAIPSGVGYGPSQLQSAYNLTAASAADGAGRTVALVDAYDDPTAAADLAAYRSAAGLPVVSSFKKVNQEGETSPLPSEAPSSDDWTLEESLDLDMVSSACPLCNIVLVEADNDSGDGLDVAENTAASLAGYVSNSWGGSEASSDTSLDTEYFDHSGVVITASAGDSDYGVEYPATSPYVVSVGGTSLSTSSNSRGWTESVWNTTTGSEGTGSGCSAYESQPSWQTSLDLASGCSKRIDNDVSADADPATGVAVYDTSNSNGGWNEVGGTSASSPFIAATYALAGNAGSTPADDIYTHTSDFYDVTSGNDGSCSPAYLCTAETGFDGPTGIGTPDGIAGLETGTTTTNTVTVTNPGSQTGTVGKAASLQISASDSASGQTLAYSATGLPTGLSISASTGLISGTPSASGTYSVKVTATDSTGATGSASFTWTISAASGGDTVTVTNPGSQTGTVGTAVSLQISATDSASGQTLTYTASGLPAGLSISSTGLISGTPTTAATSNVTVTATDTTGAAGSAGFTWTISAASGGGCTAAQLLGNPGFETGKISPWSSTSGVLNDSSAEPAHSGSWDAWLDGYGTTHTDTLSQSVTIPSTCTTATFSFWLHIDTAETTKTTAYDTLKVQVLNSSGTVLATLATFSNLNHATGYTQHSYSVAPYIGQTITLKFTGSEDSSLQTSFVDDDNAVNVD
jgi:Putative Ig domain